MLTHSIGVAGSSPTTHYPLTIENCATTLTFEHAPQRAVTIGQAGTEMLYALGLGDKLVGTSLWFNDVSALYKAQNDKVEQSLFFEAMRDVRLKRKSIERGFLERLFEADRKSVV